MEERTPVLRVESLSAAYGDDVILQDVSFEVAPGEVLVVLGGSGCGKSTLLRHLVGLRRPASGRVWIDGEDIAAARGADRRRILRKIGVMYQSGALFGSMTLAENVMLPLEEFTDLPEDARRLVARLKLGAVGLGGAGHLTPAEISGGMRKRAAIARAMALDPRLLFLDEPSAGLDPITSAELDELIVHLARSLGIAFVVVTHELASVHAIADRVIMLDRSVRGVLASGRPDELAESSENEYVRRFFQRGRTSPAG